MHSLNSYADIVLKQSLYYNSATKFLKLFAGFWVWCDKPSISVAVSCQPNEKFLGFFQNHSKQYYVPRDSQPKWFGETSGLTGSEGVLLIACRVLYLRPLSHNAACCLYLMWFIPTMHSPHVSFALLYSCFNSVNMHRQQQWNNYPFT